MRIFIAAGIPRSGSTWLFNAARLIVKNNSKRFWSGWIEELRDDLDVDFALIKLHDVSEYWRQRSDVILCSKRDLRDIAASAASMNWANSERQMIDLTIQCRQRHEFWAPSASVDLEYESGRRDPESAIGQICRALDMSASQRTLSRILGRMPNAPSKIGPYGHDPKTLLHKNHITDGRSGRWRGQLSKYVADEIWNQNEFWMIKNGYTRE